MFGTLVIQLPSNYSGGQLTVYHRSKNTVFDFSGPMGCSDFHYAAFYADCQHEIEPVTKGHRLCLVYNLIYEGYGNCPAPANNEKEISAIASSMREWNEDVNSVDCPQMITYFLEHQYCEASLSFKLLKNVDRAVADVLVQAKNDVDFDLYLANVNIKENWSAVKYKYTEPHQADELFKKCITANYIKPHDGQKSISSINLDTKYFVPEDFFDYLDPDEEELEESTGNEGATLDRQYNWAALLFWPPRKRVINVGIQKMMKLLKQDLLDPTISQDKKNGLAEDLVRECTSPKHSKDISYEAHESFFKSLQSLGNVELISAFIAKSNSSLFVRSSFSNQILDIGRNFGWGTLRSSLQAVFYKLSTSNIENYCKFLRNISYHQPSDAQKDICRSLAVAIVSALSDEQDAEPISQPMHSRYGVTVNSNTRGKEFVGPLFKCLVTLECNEQLHSLVKAFCAKPNRYPVLHTLAPACEALYESLKEGENEPFQQLLSYCISSLESLSSIAVSWSEPVSFSCSCEDCVELIHFLEHPRETQHQFNIGVKRRNHLEKILHRHSCSVTCATERKRSPYTLIVTKTQAAYEKNSKKYQNEKASLSRLQALTTGASSNGEPSAKRREVSHGEPSAKRQEVHGEPSAKRQKVSHGEPSEKV